MNPDSSGVNTAFLDIIMNMMLVFVVLYALAAILARVESETAEPVLATDGKYAVVISWPDKSNDDVDLYVMDPTGKIAFFRNRDVGLMHLEHDDLGARSDSQSVGAGQEINILKNEERVILRGVVPGEYVVNVHMFTQRDKEPIEVIGHLYRLQGTDAKLVTKVRTLRMNGDEKTMFRFRVKSDGQVTAFNELPKKLVGNTGRNQSGGPDAP